ncbi:hypothetical protein EFP14_11100 [Lactiplantibacillus pentosus]|nr:hypothetical protein [Lactiplantibacillus pentosus]
MTTKYPPLITRADIEAIMKRAKQGFIKANPLIDPAKVVVVNGEFKQPTLGDLARTDECRSITHDMIAFMANDEPHYKPRN